MNGHGVCKLCLTLAERSLSVLENKLRRYSGMVPLIEARLDYLEVPKVPVLPADSPTEFIATCRPVREGGRYDAEEGERLRLLAAAAQSGFAWVDLEHDVEESPALPPQTRVVRSYHNFGGFPGDLPSLHRRIQALGGDVAKLAMAVRGTEELVELLRWRESTSGSTDSSILIGMGSFGQPSRLLGALLGDAWAYVAEREEETAAPGQFSLAVARDVYRLSGWKTAPAVYGVLGNPVAHSLSPILHNRLFNHYGRQGVYFPFALSRLDPWFGYMETSRLSFGGFSVTLPFKTEVVRLVRRLDSPVQALNTLVWNGSGWDGLNTDFAAFLAPLKARFSLRGKKAVVLGNGGVAHSVVKALLQEGMEVLIVGRDRERVSSFAALLNCPSILFSDLPVRADLCVNTTPVGQHPAVEGSPLREDQLDFEIVYDLVYSPEDTRLLQMARRNGIVALSGMEMFVEQAALQFLAWTGVDPDRELMKTILRELSP